MVPAEERVGRFLAPRMDGQPAISSQILTPNAASRLTLEAMKPLRHSVIIICIAFAFIADADERSTSKAKGPADQPIAGELQLLQGTWEGAVVDDKGASKNPDPQETSERKPDGIDLGFLRPEVFGSPQKPREKITITVAGDSFHFHRDTDFWFATTITLPAGKDPKQLHATIKDCPPSQASSIGQVVVAIFKIEDGTLTLATGNGDGEAPKSFEASPNRYELRKVRPQKKDAQPPKTK